MIEDTEAVARERERQFRLLGFEVFTLSTLKVAEDFYEALKRGVWVGPVVIIFDHTMSPGTTTAPLLRRISSEKKAGLHTFTLIGASCNPDSRQKQARYCDYVMEEHEMDFTFAQSVLSFVHHPSHR
ncbi:MAG: hypothetical protein WD200_00360 [Candidatus Andersenbacteria bacterium]